MTRFFLLIIFISLTGCMNAAMSGASAVYNRHTLSNTINDHYISLKASREIYWKNKEYKGSRVVVTAFNDVVLITGQIPSPELRAKVVDIVKKVAPDYQIYNATEVGNVVSPLVQVSDTFISARIKGEFIAHNDIDPSKIKIITENGTVFLMGWVFPEQAQIATNLARKVPGVQSVVKVFAYVHVDDKA